MKSLHMCLSSTYKAIDKMKIRDDHMVSQAGGVCHRFVYTCYSLIKPIHLILKLNILNVTQEFEEGLKVLKIVRLLHCISKSVINV